MANTYKAIFTCEALGERVTWYVSSRKEGQRMARHHTHSRSGHLYKKYRDEEWTLRIVPVFQSQGEVGYDSSNMGWGGT